MQMSANVLSDGENRSQNVLIRDCCHNVRDTINARRSGHIFSEHCPPPLPTCSVRTRVVARLGLGLVPVFKLSSRENVGGEGNCSAGEMSGGSMPEGGMSYAQYPRTTSTPER